MKSLYLFILESIGTPELILIALVALIVLGPRKLPQMMKTAGKTMAEFRKATTEFKTTWEREASFDEKASDVKMNSTVENQSTTENTIAESALPEKLTENQLPAPEVRELSAEDFSKNFPNKKIEVQKSPAKETEKTLSDKREWL